jgi:hypothetical protein
MRFVPARIVVALLPLLFVSMGFVHVTHAHPADEVSSLHPVCTTCQFNAPVAEAGGVQSHVDGPEPGACYRAQAPAASPVIAHDRIHASRAPPFFLAH